MNVLVEGVFCWEGRTGCPFMVT